MPRQVVQRRRTVMQRYAQFLAHHPFLVLTLTLLGNIIVLLVVVCTDNIPTFDEPKAGFEPRGTFINQRTQAWLNLVAQTGSDSVLSLQPRGAGQEIAAGDREGDDIKRSSSPASSSTTTSLHEEQEEDEEEHTSRSVSLGPIVEPKGFFCGDPVASYSRIIFRRVDYGNMLEVKALRAICSIDRAIRRLPEFKTPSSKSDAPIDRYCPSWTLPNYLVALLAHRKSCRKIIESDVQHLQNLTRTCLTLFRSGDLHDHCWAGENLCPRVPGECVRDNLLYHLLYFISDNESLENNYTTIKYALGLLPVGSSAASLSLYKALRRANLSQSGVEVVAIDMGLKEQLFDAYLIEDALFMAVAAGAIVVVLWIYTTSLFVTLMNVLAIFFPLVLSYFLYSFVFRLTFFPFMNLLACVIMIAIGADALVIYAKLWHLAKTEKNDGKFEKIVYATVRHGSQAILVSSLTASAALFADAVNPIIAIRCFSIYAGLSVLVHYLFMVTWLPVTVIIADKWGSTLYSCNYLFPQRFCDTKTPLCCRFFYTSHCISSGARQFYDYFRIFFEKFLPFIVIRLKWMWIVLFILLTTAACVVIFYFPKLQLPSSRNFHLWDRSHPLEQYQLLKHWFAFENNTSVENTRMPLRFVWGVLPTNNAQLLEPHDTGMLVFDPLFDLSAPLSQVWMIKFCNELRTQPFYHENGDIPIANCFVLSLKEWMAHNPCQKSHFCCKDMAFPLEPAVFSRCSETFATILKRTAIKKTKHAGPKFDAQNHLRSVVIEYDSTQFFSFSFPEIQAFHKTVETWFQEILATAPPELSRGWFHSHLDFLDLQESLCNGTLLSLIVSVLIALLVLFMTTLNVGVSILAIVTILGIMLAVIAALVLLGWQLNVFESTVMGLAVGLSVDFTLHYAVSYCNVVNIQERELKANHVIAEMASPVTMSAVTSFLAGALMVPSELLIYKQIGVFIMLVISISLIYATIFYPAMLALMGPEGNCLQFSYPPCPVLCCRTDPAKLVEKSMRCSSEFDATITTGTTERENHHHHKKVAIPKTVVTAVLAPEFEGSPKGPLRNIYLDAALAEEETDSVGELGSVPTSRGPSRGSSLVRKQGKGLFSWDYVMQKLPLTRHFSVANSSVIYIDSDVRSVTSDVNADLPALLPNVRDDVPEVWVRRID